MGAHYTWQIWVIFPGTESHRELTRAEFQKKKNERRKLGKAPSENMFINARYIFICGTYLEKLNDTSVK